jgi:hypothetical protein
MFVFPVNFRRTRDGAHMCSIAMVSGNIPCRVQIKNLQHLSVGSLEPQVLFILHNMNKFYHGYVVYHIVILATQPHLPAR